VTYARARFVLFTKSPGGEGAKEGAIRGKKRRNECHAIREQRQTCRSKRLKLPLASGSLGGSARRVAGPRQFSAVVVTAPRCVTPRYERDSRGLVDPTRRHAIHAFDREYARSSRVPENSNPRATRSMQVRDIRRRDSRDVDGILRRNCVRTRRYAWCVRSLVWWKYRVVQGEMCAMPRSWNHE